MHASNSPNGRSLVLAPRRGESYGQESIFESFVLSHHPPASSTMTRAPAAVRAWAVMAPPAPDPTMHTSYDGLRGWSSIDPWLEVRGLAHKSASLPRELRVGSRRA